MTVEELKTWAEQQRADAAAKAEAQMTDTLSKDVVFQMLKTREGAMQQIIDNLNQLDV